MINNIALTLISHVSAVKILTDETSGESLGLAFVWFANEKYTELAIKQMNGQVWFVFDLNLPSQLNQSTQKETRNKCFDRRISFFSSLMAGLSLCQFQRAHRKDEEMRSNTGFSLSNCYKRTYFSNT